MGRQRPHDTRAGSTPDIRSIAVDVLADNWLALRRATFDQRQPDGAWHTEQREAYDRGDGAVALLHPERGTVLLVRQYRAPAHLNDHPDGMLLEAPAGLLDDGEGAHAAMQRELAEEVGHHVTDLIHLWTLYMSPGSVTEHLSFFTGTYSAATRAGQGEAPTVRTSTSTSSKSPSTMPSRPLPPARSSTPRPSYSSNVSTRLGTAELMRGADGRGELSGPVRLDDRVR